MFHVCLCNTVLSGPCSLVMTCWERADLLAFLCVTFHCIFVMFPCGARVRCGTRLYRFLIFPFFFSFCFESKVLLPICLMHIHSLRPVDYKHFIYSKTCVKRSLSKGQKIGFQDQLSLNAGQKYCRMRILQCFRPALS